MLEVLVKEDILIRYVDIIKLIELQISKITQISKHCKGI